MEMEVEDLNYWADRYNDFRKLERKGDV